MILASAVGCSVAEPGTAVKAPGGPPPGTVDVSLLGSGNLPTKPAPPLGAAGSPAAGALIDARRMADDVVGPWDVDPALVIPSPLRAVIVKDAAAIGLIEPTGVAPAAQGHNFINGFASDRQDQDQDRLMNAVLRFADPSSAAGAAADMAKAVTTGQPNPARPVPIPGHPDASATTYSYNSYGGDERPITVLSYTAHGAYVLCQTAQADDIDTAAALIGKTLDTQGPLIDQFVPTDPAKFAELPADPTGLLAHTMPTPTYPEGEDAFPPNPKVGLYGPHAALHLQDDPLAVAAAFTTAGVALMSYNQTVVYQTRDSAAAARLAVDLANSAVTAQPSTKPVEGVDFMPTSRCVQSDRPEGNGQSDYYCYAPVQTFTIQTHAADATGARQQAAAQYKMLLAG
ncbi:MAG TPA: hypothetical protein VMU34_26710 [Mycobacterium sp.]|nr:hypothetical protein [Mycobacterium sp.]